MICSDPLEILLKHDLWATHAILSACEKLSAEQMHQHFEMGPGSVHATVTHIIGAIRGWTDALLGREPRPRPETDNVNRTTADLSQLLDESYGEFAQQIKSHPLDQTITRTRAGKTMTFTRGVVLVHVTTHGMHHRAQVLNMLRHLSVNPLPPSSVAEWSMMAQQ